MDRASFSNDFSTKPIDFIATAFKTYDNYTNYAGVSV